MSDRPRRLRQNAAIRAMVRENSVRPEQLILPMFVRDIDRPEPISTMPGVVQHSMDSLVAAALEAKAAGVGGVMLFGVPATRDACGTQASDPNGILARGIKALRAALGPDFLIVADICLDEFTDHGHCGLLDAEGRVDNDSTVEAYAQMAVVQAQAGANVMGLSGMMDFQVAAVREALDDAGRSDVMILAYSAKYASAFYGPFREAVQSQLKGDRRTYQQDPANRRESLREIQADVDQGADIIMVKPGLPYLDIVSDAADSTELPVAVYLVSGEYAMIEFAAAAGAIDRRACIMEAHTAATRAGADIICTYWATQVANWLQEG